MATFVQAGTDLRRVVSGAQLIGRSRNCDWILSSADVSAQHATLRYRENCWELRDLASRNGTYVGDERLPSGEGRELGEKDRVRFGASDPEWVLEDASPPTVHVVRLRDGHVLGAAQGLISLGSVSENGASSEGNALVYRGRSGQWALEQDEQTQLLEDDHVFEFGGDQWRLAGVEDAATAELTRILPTVESAELAFSVTANEEHVELAISQAGGEAKIEGRAFLYLLLTLARERISEQPKAAVGASAGWVPLERLSSMLRRDRHHINVDIFRARSSFADLGFEDPANVVERRRDSGEVRIGCPNLRELRI